MTMHTTNSDPKELTMSNPTTPGPFWTTNADGSLVCPHRDLSVCPECAATTPGVVEAAGAHFLADEPEPMPWPVCSNQLADADRYTFGRYTVTAYGENAAEVASDTALLLVTLVEHMHLPHTDVTTIRILPSGDHANSVAFTVVTDDSDDGGVFGPDGQLVLDADRAAAYTQAAAICRGVA